MEFLGDAILQAVISEALYRLHPEKDEGHLTKARARLVNGTSLAAKADALGLGQYLVLGRGQQSDFDRGKDSALEDVFEALVAALYLDGGLDAASDFVRRVFEDELANPDSIAVIENPKGRVAGIFPGHHRRIADVRAAQHFRPGSRPGVRGRRPSSRKRTGARHRRQQKGSRVAGRLGRLGQAGAEVAAVRRSGRSRARYRPTARSGSARRPR